MQRKFSSIVLLSVIVITFLTSLASMQGVGAAGVNPCASCHSSSQASGGYVFSEPLVSFFYPQVVTPNSTFILQSSITTPRQYEILNATAKVSMSGMGNFTPGELAKKTMTGTTGISSANWTLQAKDLKGTISVALSLNFTAYRKHSTSATYDDYPYTINSQYLITVKPAALQLQKGQVLFVIGGQALETVNIIVESDVRNVSISESPNLKGNLNILSPQNLDYLHAGQQITISLTLSGRGSVVDNGRIDLIWVDEKGVADSTFIYVRIMENTIPSSGDSPLKWAGRITGLVTFGLLAFSIFLGIVKIGKELRVRLHCAVSWFLLVLSLYHGLVLIIGPYASIAFGKYIILGDVSALLMGVAAINGLLEKRITEATNHTIWVWMHRTFLYSATVLSVVHGVLIGTDFAFIRTWVSV